MTHFSVLARRRKRFLSSLKRVCLTYSANICSLKAVVERKIELVYNRLQWCSCCSKLGRMKEKLMRSWVKRKEDGRKCEKREGKRRVDHHRHQVSFRLLRAVIKRSSQCDKVKGRNDDSTVLRVIMQSYDKGGDDDDDGMG